jgi:hypothetical protein
LGHTLDLKTVTSGGNGAFAATLALAVGGRLRAAIDGDQLRSHRVEVSVAPHVTLAAAAHRASVGSRLLFRARVLPRYRQNPAGGAPLETPLLRS